jgi:hypothetical protein
LSRRGDRERERRGTGQPEQAAVHSADHGILLKEEN